MRRNVTDLRVEVSAEQAKEHPKVYTRIDLRYLVKGQGLKDKDVRRAIELSNTKFCSAAIMLGKTAEVVWDFEIEEEG
jgi:putative redox protein